VELLDKVRQRFLWVLICAILGVAVGVGYAYSTGGGYRATARLFVSTSATDAIAAAQGDIAGQSRVKTYAALATGQLLLERAAQRSHTGVDANYIADRLTVVPIPGTVILEIDVTGEDSNFAAGLADAVSTELTEVATELETPINGGPRAQGLLTIQPASSGIVKIGRITPQPVVLGGILGFVAGLSLAALMPARKVNSATSAKHASTDLGRGDTDNKITGAMTRKVIAAPDTN
jgi:capsular polysaccharide biosynthesis protein